MSTSAATATIDPHLDPSTATGIPNKKLLLWAFLASDCMFFGALLATHLIYRLHPVPGNPSPRDIFNPELTSFSTFILLMSSLMMALAGGLVLLAGIYLWAMEGAEGYHIHLDAEGRIVEDPHAKH